MQSTNDDTAVAMLGGAIDSALRGLRGTLVQGATVTPDAVYEGDTIREWLTALRGEIDKYLA